jgi:mRNA interferase RelE/StbE
LAYHVRLTRAARQDLSESIPAAVAFAVMEFIQGPLATSPFRVGHPLLPPFEGQWLARRGQYRIVYEVRSETVYIRRVEHRTDAYHT